MSTDAFAGSLTLQTRPVVLRSLGDVSVAPDTTVTLGDRFARELPELAVRWQAEAAPEPHAEKAGWAREGVRRRAYWRDDTWVDGVLFGLLDDELDDG